MYRKIVPAEGVDEDRATAPTLEEFKQRLRAVAGTDFGAHSPRWLSRFGDASRQAERYRAGRVLPAGDAAHIHYPAGGQGLNVGLQARSTSAGNWPPRSTAGRRRGCWTATTPNGTRRGARVLANTRAQGVLMGAGPGATALRELFSELMDFEDVNRYVTEMITGVGVRYDVGEGHDLLGRRMRDAGLKQGRLYRLAEPEPAVAAKLLLDAVSEERAPVSA